MVVLKTIYMVIL